jgi:two-component system cell cycle sensor histidine kinase/response regulator CckA
MERTDFEQWKGREVARLLALVETERRYYQEIVAALPVALAVLSPDRSVVSANRAFRQTFGLTVDEVRKKVIEQILPSDALIEKIRDMHVHGMSRAPFPIESKGKTYRVGIVPIRNWDEDMELETLLTVEDLTEFRVQTAQPAVVPVVSAPEFVAPEVVAVPEPVAARAGAFALSGLERLPAVVWQADPVTLAFSAVGGAAESMLGYPADHWTESPSFFADRIHPDDREAAIALYRSAIERGGEASAEFRAVTAAGTTVWCRETVLAPSPGAGSGVLCGVLTAFSKRKQAEQQMVAAERHAALSGISARLAHDLNNPLMIITGYSEEMQHGFGASDPRRGDVEQILSATQRIADLTTQLLQFNRRTAAPPQPVNLATEITRIEEKLAETVGDAASLDISTDDAVWAQADPLQLENVLLALVSSSREDAEGRTRVALSCDSATIAEIMEHGVLAPGPYARIVVEDNGKGLPPAKRAAMFESFLAKDPGRSESVALAYAYNTVREWGGDLAVESAPFTGTRFTVYLPTAEPIIPEPEPPAPEPVTEVASEGVLVEPEPPRQRILVVDDEPGIRALVAKILRREKYEVLEAGSAHEAMSLAAQHEAPIDLLVTDVMLPDQSGRDLAGHFSRAFAGVKVLYISGFTDDESVRIGDFPPGSKFLQKPFTLGALVGRVREAMES